MSKEENDKESTSAADQPPFLLRAEHIAVLTGLGYAYAFVYQMGLVTYYGLPLETIRVSSEWVLFVVITVVLGYCLSALLGFVLGGFAPIPSKGRVARWLRRNAKPIRGVTAVAFAIVLGFVVLGVGRSAAEKRTWYLVDATHERVLVYSTDAVYVFVDYDKEQRRFGSSFTYVSSSDSGSAGMTLSRTDTGSLRAGLRE